MSCMIAFAQKKKLRLELELVSKGDNLETANAKWNKSWWNRDL